MARQEPRMRINGSLSSTLVRRVFGSMGAALTIGCLDKKLLITCLQFLNNLVSRNEQRKLMLWIELFDSHLDNELPNFADMKYKMDAFPRSDKDSKPKIEATPTGQKQAYGPDAFKIPQQPASSPFLLYIGEIGNEVKRSLAQQGEKTGATEIAAECRRRWQTMSEEEKNVCLPCPIFSPIHPPTIVEMEHALCRCCCQISR